VARPGWAARDDDAVTVVLLVLAPRTRPCIHHPHYGRVTDESKSQFLGRFLCRTRVTEFGHSGDSTPPWHDSDIAATTSNLRIRTGRMSASLDTTVEAGKSLTGEPLRNPLTAKQRSSPTWLRWVRASPDPYLRGSSPCGQYAPAAASRKAEASCKAPIPVVRGQPSPTLGDALNAGYLYLEVRYRE